MDFHTIIVAGTQRSGTTLTGQILGAHSNNFLIDESDGLYQWSDDWLSATLKPETLFDQSIKTAAEKYLDIRKSKRTFRDVKNLHLVLKAPNLTFEASRLSVKNHVQVVFVVRDVRAVVASILSLKKSKMLDNQTAYLGANEYLKTNHQSDVELLNDEQIPSHIRAALIWKLKNHLYDEFIEKGLNPLMLKYENLVVQPVNSAKSMCDHLGLEFEQAMNQHHKLMSGRAPGKTRRNRSIDTSSLNKWKAQLSEKQEQEVLELTGSYMKELGY